MTRRGISAAVLVCVLALATSALADGVPGGTSADGTSTAPASVKALASATQRLGQRTLHRGSRGSDVRALQQILTDLGYPTTVTGRFGLPTLRQVRRFQRAQHLEVDGKVGPKTASALRSAEMAKHPELNQLQDVTPNAEGWAFPIRGPHNYGTAINRYGAPRSGHTHQGQDVMANCGIPLVAARAGKVVAAGSGGAAGNYLAVHTTDTPYDYFYAHLRSVALVREGQTVRTGELVGYVGETGDATACHLHFELWQGGWWDGGHTIDPLPFLKAWDASS